MREILFRGKRVDNGEWISGDLITTPFIRNETQQNIIYILDITKADYDCFEDLTEDNGIFEVNPETVCQYTGLTDKNGRKIFDGYICRDSDNIVRILWNDKHQWGVEISKTDNVLSRGLVFPLWQYDNCKENGYRTLEVIGNIFDNPELIGEQP